MILSNKYKFIFFCPTGNCATTSVQKLLLPFHDESSVKNSYEANFNHELNEVNPFGTEQGFRGVIPLDNKLVVAKHCNPQGFLDYNFFDKYKFDSYLKFSVVRNPWSLVLAHYWKNFIPESIRIKFKSSHSNPIPAQSFGVTNALQTINDMLSSEFFNKSQYQTLCDSEGNFLINEVIKFENLNKDLENLLVKLKIKDFKLSHEQDNHNFLNDRTIYSDEAKDLVAETFKIDIEKFSYSFL